MPIGQPYTPSGVPVSGREVSRGRAKRGRVHVCKNQGMYPVEVYSNPRSVLVPEYEGIKEPKNNGSATELSPKQSMQKWRRGAMVGLIREYGANQSDSHACYE